MRPFIDPELLPLVAEQRAVNERLRAAAAGVPSPGTIEPGRLRRSRLYNRDGSFRHWRDDSAVDGALATGSDEVRIRTFSAPDARRTIIHFHGGGWVLGSIHEQDRQLARLATDAASTVVSVDYPLAPEHQLPRTLDVASAALEAVLARDVASPVAILGESAGAHVALSSVLRLDATLRCRVRALSLAYGIYDLSMTPSQRQWGSAFLGLSTDWLEWFYAQSLPGLSRDARSDPRWSPLYADLTALPPMLLNVGELDPLLDDSLFLFERCRAAGNDTSLIVYPEAPHGFNHQATAMAARYNAAVAAFLGSSFTDINRAGTVRPSCSVGRPAAKGY